MKIWNIYSALENKDSLKHITEHMCSNNFTVLQNMHILNVDCINNNSGKSDVETCQGHLEEMLDWSGFSKSG